MKKFCLFLITLILAPDAFGEGRSLTSLEKLGRSLFFDRNLSSPPVQSCATCHGAEAGWTGPDSEINEKFGVYHGAMSERFGNRRPPSVAYATYSPPLFYDDVEEAFVGGMFWDGRASGWRLGSPTVEQAQGPFLNPLEQNNSDAVQVIKKVCTSDYSHLMVEVFGENICSEKPEYIYDKIAIAIDGFEKSSVVNRFDSKFDYYLADPERYPLTEQEKFGMELFTLENKGNCAACHTITQDNDAPGPLFTDFTYDNIGTPKNLSNPWYNMPDKYNPDGWSWVDPGLGGFLATTETFAHLARTNLGKHKVPTLRNVDKRPHPEFKKSYMHNGVFKSLKEVVHFYNTRDVLPSCKVVFDPIQGHNCWNPPEEWRNINQEELGKLGLTEEEEWAIVAFMKTLSDGWTLN